MRIPGKMDGQLELFTVSSAPAPAKPRAPGELRLRLRHDQAILCGIAGLIGMTVVFAWGVERGKQLARLERPLPLPHQFIPAQAARRAAERPEPEAPPVEQTAVQEAPVAPAKPSEESGPSRYAVQVVTYSRPHLAKSELDRLQDSGEVAFVQEQQGRTVLYVGPFTSIARAREKRAMLKGRYHDCFVRPL